MMDKLHGRPRMICERPRSGEELIDIVFFEHPDRFRQVWESSLFEANPFAICLFVPWSQRITVNKILDPRIRTILVLWTFQGMN